MLDDPLKIAEFVNNTNIAYDSRMVKPKDLFVAIPGANTDGHKYILEAIRNGATKLIVNKNFKADINIPNNIQILQVTDPIAAIGVAATTIRNNFNIPVIGITGSCGKTTTREMLLSILKLNHKVLASEKNYNTDIGLPITLCKLNSSYNYAILEMGARKAGDIKYLCDIARPNLGIITNVGPSHLESMGSLDNIAKVKGELYKSIPNNETVVINLDDKFASYWIDSLNKQNVVTFGINSTAQIKAKIKDAKQLSQFTLITTTGCCDINLQVLGKHNIYNALSAAAAAYSLGITLADIKLGLESFSSVSKRLQFLSGINGAKIIDDSYNASPLSCKAALEILANFNNKKILVIGDMAELGKSAELEHKLLGEQAKKLGIDIVLACGNLSNYVVNSFGDNGKYFINKPQLLQHLLTELDKNTVVLIKGSRFMQMEQITQAILDYSQIEEA